MGVVRANASWFSDAQRARLRRNRKWAACKKWRYDKRTRTMRSGIKCLVASGVKGKLVFGGGHGPRLGTRYMCRVQ